MHGFAGPFGGMFDAPHGAVCAALLPHVMAANVAALRERAPEHPSLRCYDEVARLLTGDARASADDGATWVRDLVADLGVPGLAAYGLDEAAFDALIPAAGRSSSMKGNPVALSDSELRIHPGAGDGTHEALAGRPHPGLRRADLGLTLVIVQNALDDVAPMTPSPGASPRLRSCWPRCSAAAWRARVELRAGALRACGWLAAASDDWQTTTTASRVHHRAERGHGARPGDALPPAGARPGAGILAATVGLAFLSLERDLSMATGDLWC